MNAKSDALKKTHSTPIVQPLLLTVKQAMALGAIGKTSLYQAAGRGLFKVRKLGRSTRIERASFEAYLDTLPNAKIGTTQNSE